MNKRGGYCCFIYFMKERSVDMYKLGDKKGSPKAGVQPALSFCLLSTKRRVKYASLLLRRASNKKE